MSNLTEFAKRELQLVGYDLDQKEEDPNKWLVENVLELIKTFSEQGHSGASAPYCINIFRKLALFQSLSPLTGQDDEWNLISENEDDGRLWQNRRCHHVFKSEKDGSYDIDGKVFVTPDGVQCTRGTDTRVPVTFPYVPKTEVVHVEE